MTTELCYFNNGLSFRWVDQPYTPAAGEVLFSATPTGDQLTSSFAGYAAAVAAETVGASILAAIAAGVTLTFATTTTLNGLYGVTQQDQLNLIALQAAISAGQTVPTKYQDSTGTRRTVTNATMAAICAAVFSYVAGIVQFEDGINNSLPSSTVSVNA